MPQLIDFYEEFEDRRDEFEIIAFHRDNMRSFEELDPDLEDCKDKYWEGRELPFPILLDDSGDTIRRLGISSYPTILLIGPDGKLRKRGGEYTLRKELMTTDKEVVKLLKRLKAARGSKFPEAAESLAAQDDEQAAWALMLFAGDEKRAKKAQLLTLLPLLAGMKSEAAHGFLFGAQGLSAEKAWLRLAAIDALKTVAEPPEMLPYILSQALEKEEDAKVKKALEGWLEELRE